MTGFRTRGSVAVGASARAFGIAILAGCLILLHDAGHGTVALTSGERVASAEAAPEADPPSDLAGKPALEGAARYRAIAEMEAKRAGLPGAMADSVMAVESGYNPAAIGGSGEIGLMQILPSTARMLGFVGTNADLATPETNIHFGVTYLAQAWRLASQDICTTVMKYRAGHGETRFSVRSVDYCLAVRQKLTARGFPVTGSVPVATFGDSDGPRGGALRPSGSRRYLIGSHQTGTADFAALNSRINQIVVQVTVRAIPTR